MNRKSQREKGGGGREEGERMGRKEREREKSVRQTNRQLDRDSQIVVHVIAIKQSLHTHTFTVKWKRKK